MDCTQHLEAGLEDVHWNMDICDDGVEEVDAVFHVAFLRGVLANVHDALKYLLQIAVSKNPGIELANIGGIVEYSPHVLCLLQRPVRAALAAYSPVRVEGVSASLEASIESIQNERHNGGLAGCNVLAAVGEGGNDLEAPLEASCGPAVGCSIEDDSTFDRGQLTILGDALEKLVTCLGYFIGLLGQNQVVGHGPQTEYVLQGIFLQDPAYFLDSICSLYKRMFFVQLLDQFGELRGSSRHVGLDGIAGDLGDALQAIVG
jgi:hypothetical protein